LQHGEGRDHAEDENRDGAGDVKMKVGEAILVDEEGQGRGGARRALKLRKFVRVDNASITLCEYTNHKRWKLITWNDCAHLECLANLSPHGSDFEFVGLRRA
jgi:broad specificity phosphatase PhoE